MEFKHEWYDLTSLDWLKSICQIEGNIILKEKIWGIPKRSIFIKRNKFNIRKYKKINKNKIRLIFEW